MIKICVTGPESSGKTTIASQLAKHFDCQLVLEFAREYLEKNGAEYDQSDLLAIAQGQLKAENDAQGRIVICDTSLEVIQIWSEWKYGSCDAWIETQVENSAFDLYLLCTPDIPWEEDPLRENPTDRNDLFTKYSELLYELNKPVLIVSGSAQERAISAISKINELNIR